MSAIEMQFKRFNLFDMRQVRRIRYLQAENKKRQPEGAAYDLLWWAVRDSNPGPPACEAGALTG